MHEIADRNGEFTLFGLLKRSNSLGDWDLVVSAPWLERGKLKTLSEFVDLLAKSIGRESLPQFARVESVPSDDPTLEFILDSFPVEDGEIRIQNMDLFGLQIEEAILFRARRPDSGGAAPGTPVRAGGSSRHR